MDNRNKLRQIKKQIKNRKIHRKKENNNRTRTSISHTYLFNILIGLKHDAEEQITRKPKKDNKIQIHIQNQHQHINWKHKRRTAQTTNRQPRRNTNNKLKKIIDMAKKD